VSLLECPTGRRPTMPRFFNRRLRHPTTIGAFLLLITTLVIAGCGSDLTWKTNNITSVMPDLQFTLTDDGGRTVHESNYQGKVQLLFFGYTHCPDVCPLTLATIGRALHRLGDQADAARVLFVSVDPERDTPK